MSLCTLKIYLLVKQLLIEDDELLKLAANGGVLLTLKDHSFWAELKCMVIILKPLVTASPGCIGVGFLYIVRLDAGIG